MLLGSPHLTVRLADVPGLFEQYRLPRISLQLNGFRR
jgi:hypothetical protein